MINYFIFEIKWTSSTSNSFVDKFLKKRDSRVKKGKTRKIQLECEKLERRRNRKNRKRDEYKGIVTKVSGRGYRHDTTTCFWIIWYTPIGRIINDTSSMNNDTATPNNRTFSPFCLFLWYQSRGWHEASRTIVRKETWMPIFTFHSFKYHV